MVFAAGAGRPLTGIVHSSRTPDGVSRFEVPISTVSKPTSQFQSLILRYGTTLSTGPGFGVELCLGPGTQGVGSSLHPPTRDIELDIMAFVYRFLRLP